MKFRLTRLILFATFIAFIVLSFFLTFRQEAFLQDVSADFLFWKTPQIPITMFIAISFVCGLSIGLTVALMDHFATRKQLKELQTTLHALQTLVPVERKYADTEEKTADNVSS